jgi:hypothetical protein
MSSLKISKKQSSTKQDAEAQSRAFTDAARALGCDEDPAHFDEALKKVARHKPVEKKPEEPSDGKKRRVPSERS